MQNRKEISRIGSGSEKNEFLFFFLEQEQTIQIQMNQDQNFEMAMKQCMIPANGPSPNIIHLVRLLEPVYWKYNETNKNWLEKPDKKLGPNMIAENLEWFGRRLYLLKFSRETLDESMEQIEEDKKHLSDAQYLHFMFGAKTFNEVFFSSPMDKLTWQNRELIQSMLDHLGVTCTFEVKLVNEDSKKHKQQKRTNNKKKKKKNRRK